MTVAHIIDEKGSAVVTSPPDATLAEIAATLAEKGIGAVLVVEREAISGIVSERDVVRAIARRGADALGMKASEFMTRAVVTCAPDETIHDVMQKMTAGRFRHIPVVAGAKLAGIISIGDVVKRRIQDVETEAAQIREYIATA